MDRTPKQVQDLTLALLYLTSLEPPRPRQPPVLEGV